MRRRCMFMNLNVPLSNIQVLMFNFQEIRCFRVLY